MAQAKKKKAASKRKSVKKAVPQKLTNTPDWQYWNRMPSITVTGAICLIHNIRPNAKALLAVKVARDNRYKNFRRHLLLLKRWLPNTTGPLRVRPKKKIITDGTLIGLNSFIDWVKTSAAFDEDFIGAYIVDTTKNRG